jgi:phosphatidylethanolamine/phosphatidyl-N-methylethanolamine N-methyltransferase
LNGSRATARTRARYDRIAPVYDLMEGLMERSARRWRRLLWAQVEGDSILEVGVGTGKNMPYYPKGPKITAIDLSTKMLQRARRRAEREKIAIELRQMDAQALDFPDKSFDTVVASFVFCSVPDPVLGLRELGRVAKGKVLLLEHMRPANPWLGKVFDLLNPLVARLFGFNINRRTLENIRKAGLEIERVQNLDRLGIFKLIAARPGSASDSDSKGLYRCPECGLEYKEKEWAEECEGWCKKYKSCNPEIIKHAVERR